MKKPLIVKVSHEWKSVILCDHEERPEFVMTGHMRFQADAREIAVAVNNHEGLVGLANELKDFTNRSQDAYFHDCLNALCNDANALLAKIEQEKSQ